ncbi:MAG: thrombospondin type 3 repeat-containing protein [bacterium]
MPGNAPFTTCYSPTSDQDGDGIVDAGDNCPFSPNPDQQDIDNFICGTSWHRRSH